MSTLNSRFIPRFSGWLALLSFALYAGDVLQGKARVALGWEPWFQLGEVGEFLVLLLAALFFVIHILYREAQSSRRSPAATTEENHVQ